MRRRAARDDLTYAERGATAGVLPEGYEHVDRLWELGRGAALFESTRRALFTWRMLPPRSWLRIHPAEPCVDAGEDRVLCVRVFGSWWTSPVRVVDACGREAGSNRAALTWGTLPGHHVVGEERFEVALRADGAVVYRLRAFARWSKLPARLAPGLARIAQRRFARDSVRALAGAARAEAVREVTP